MKDIIIWYDMVYFVILLDLKKIGYVNRWVLKILKNIKKFIRFFINLYYKICYLKIIDN